MLGTMECAALQGFSATKVTVEVDISRGLPSFQLVGLAENSVKEARVRVQSAIINAGLEFPKAKISVNLAPADMQKSGTSFDLAIALAILQASGVIGKAQTDGIAAIGELSLTGEIRPVRGMLALSEAIKSQGFHTLVVGRENGVEASLVKGLSVKIASNFVELVTAIMQGSVDTLDEPSSSPDPPPTNYLLDMSDVIGQEEARRALLIAAAGNHNVIFLGGPGSGKSMMAHRMPSILPPLSFEEAMVLTKIYSIAGFTLQGSLIHQRPFRAPHHSITKAGFVGGGSKSIRPGEISLACFGVLFLDELLEFPRMVLESLRQPLEDGSITISRATNSVTFPARLSLVGALNPCPCGNFGQKKRHCICSPLAIERYQARLSGPLIDRIDLHVNVPPVNLQLMSTQQSGESSASMRAHVMRARAHQHQRMGPLLQNGTMTRHAIKEFAHASSDAMAFLLSCSEKLSMSARGFDRIIRVARTIADLDDSLSIAREHIAEALHYRPSVSFLSCG